MPDLSFLTDWVFHSSFRVVSSILASFCCLFLVGLTAFRPQKNVTLKLFIFSNIALSLWNLSDAFILVAPPHLTVFFDRLSYFFALFVVPGFFLLLIHAAREREVKLLISRPLIAAIVFFALITFTPLLIKDVKLVPRFEEIPGPLYPLFVAYFVSWIVYGLVSIYVSFRASQGVKRNQLKYFLFAISIGLVAAVNYFLSIFIPNVPPFYYLIEAGYSLLVAYAVIRYKLMDFNLLVRLGLARGALVAGWLMVFAGILYLSDLLTKDITSIPRLSTFIGVLLLVLIYEPVQNKITVFIDKFIFRSPDVMDLIGDLDEVTRTSPDLESYSSQLSEKLKRIWKVEHAGIAIWSSIQTKFLTLPSASFRNEVVNRIGLPITMSDFLVKTLETERRLFSFGIVFEDELTYHGFRASPGERLTFWKMRRTMRWLGAAACAPIMSDTQLLGFFILGPKVSGGTFNQEDKKILSHLSKVVAPATRQLALNS